MNIIVLLLNCVINVIKNVCATRSPAITTSWSALNVVPLACALQSVWQLHLITHSRFSGAGGNEFEVAQLPVTLLLSPVCWMKSICGSFPFLDLKIHMKTAAADVGGKAYGLE